MRSSNTELLCNNESNQPRALKEARVFFDRKILCRNLQIATGLPEKIAVFRSNCSYTMIMSKDDLKGVDHNMVNKGLMERNLDRSKYPNSFFTKPVKQEIMNDFNQMEEQVREIKLLIENDRYVDDVIQQIAALQSSMNSARKLLLEGHVKSCVVDRLQDGDLNVIDGFFAPWLAGAAMAFSSVSVVLNALRLQIAEYFSQVAYHLMMPDSFE